MKVALNTIKQTKLKYVMTYIYCILVPITHAAFTEHFITKFFSNMVTASFVDQTFVIHRVTALLKKEQKY